MPAGLLGFVACGDPDPDDLVRKTIGPRGGLISSYDQVLTIVLQPGALERELEIEVFPSDEPPPIFGPAYRVRPQVELLVDAEITYRRVLPSNPNAATVAAIRLDDYTAEMGHWVPLTRLATAWFGPQREELSVPAGSEKVQPDPLWLGQQVKAHSFLRALLAATRPSIMSDGATTSAPASAWDRACFTSAFTVVSLTT